MKKTIISGMVAMAAVVASSSVYSVPGGNGTQVSHYKNISDRVEGGICDGDICANFTAYTFDDSTGLQGTVLVDSYDSVTSESMFISCSGPAFANAVSVNKTKGTSSVYATLNPLDTSCVSVNVSASITVDLTGQYDGYAKFSNHGNGNSIIDGVNYKYNFQGDTFTVISTGTTGLYTGTLPGQAETYRYTELTKVK